MIVRLQLAVLLLAFVIGCGSRDHADVDTERSNAGHGFVSHVHRDASGGGSKYTVFVPASYRDDSPCPAILFLHGAGQIGDDGVLPAEGGLGAAIREREDDFPFLTIFPQSQEGGWLADSADGRRAFAILDDVRSRYNVDDSRIFLTGYSMGGEGVWSLAAARPELFAALVPICPGRNEGAAGKIAQIPCWCFQGAADDPRLVGDTREMMLSLKRAGGRPIYREYPEFGHDCWDAAYRDEEMMKWIFDRRRNLDITSQLDFN